MLRFMVVNKEQVNLLFDKLNVMIIKEIIREPLNVTQISERLNEPIPTVWRRLKRLEKGGLIEAVKVEKVGKFKVKYYRAKALYYALPNFIQIHPRDIKVKFLYEKLLSLRNRVLQAYPNEIPDDVDPIDYAVLMDIIMNYGILFDNEGELKELVEEARNYFFSFMKRNVK